MRLFDNYYLPRNNLIKLEFSVNKNSSGSSGGGKDPLEKILEPPEEFSVEEARQHRLRVGFEVLWINELLGGIYDEFIPSGLRKSLSAQLLEIKSVQDSGRSENIKGLMKIILNESLGFKEKLEAVSQKFDIVTIHNKAAFRELDYSLNELRLDKALNTFFNGDRPFVIKYNLLRVFNYSDLGKNLLDPFNPELPKSLLEDRVMELISNLQAEQIRVLQNAYKFANNKDSNLFSRMEILREKDKESKNNGEILPSEELLTGIPFRDNFYLLFSDLLYLIESKSLQGLEGFDKFDEKFILRLAEKLFSLHGIEKIRDIMLLAAGMVVEIRNKDIEDAQEQFEELLRIL